MRENIYFGDVDMIDTRTGRTVTVPRVLFNVSQQPNEVRDRALHSIPRHERQHYQVKRLPTESAKVIGVSI